MKCTPLYEQHKALGAKLVDFNGWEMPLLYNSIVNEHLTVRNAVGLFDVSHMGDILVSGKGANELMERLFTNDVFRAEFGHSKYTHILNKEGIILDDMIVIPIREKKYLCIPNAGTTQKILIWFKRHATTQKIENVTDKYVCLAVQGPKAAETLQKLTAYDLNDLKFFRSDYIRLDGENNRSTSRECLISRTGYTGEDGFEIVVEKEIGKLLWSLILWAGEEFGIKPIGLGARDTLRLEKGFLLSGQDFNENRTTLEANHEWVIEWDHDFIGRDALLKQKEKGDYDRFVGIQMLEKSVPRNGYKIMKEGKVIGEVTSGCMSPCLKKGIALGYIKDEYKEVGTPVNILIRGKYLEGEVVKLPFVKRLS